MTARPAIAPLLVLLAGALLAGDARAQACWPNGVASDADHVFLRQQGQCGSLDNCLEDDGTPTCSVSTLNTWLWGGGRTPAPSAGDRVTVDIGPGSFPRAIVCANAGHVTFRGAGREVTELTGGPAPGVFTGINTVVRVTECDALEFRDMAFRIGSGAVYWVNGGSSKWTDVDVEGGNIWYDVCPFEGFGIEGSPWDPPKGEHVWFGSRLIGHSYGYLSGCGLSRFYGSEIHLDVHGTPGGAAVVLNHRARHEYYGSTIRVTTQDASPSIPAGEPVVGATLGYAVTVNNPQAGYGDLRMYGGIISVDATGITDGNAIGIHFIGQAGAQYPQAERASAETLDTAFILRPGGAGEATRIRNEKNGIVRSPFLWQSGPDPAVNPRLDASRDGRDLFVEVDCLSTGDCDADCSSQTCEPHVMIYRSACTTGGPWWDSATKACRQ